MEYQEVLKKTYLSHDVRSGTIHLDLVGDSQDIEADIKVEPNGLSELEIGASSVDLVTAIGSLSRLGDDMIRQMRYLANYTRTGATLVIRNFDVKTVERADELSRMGYTSCTGYKDLAIYLQHVGFWPVYKEDEGDHYWAVFRKSKAKPGIYVPKFVTPRE